MKILKMCFIDLMSYESEIGVLVFRPPSGLQWYIVYSLRQQTWNETWEAMQILRLNDLVNQETRRVL